MELSRIESLLRKYFEGETTLSEEKELSAYFTGAEVAPHLKRYKVVFQYYKQELLETVPTTITETSETKSWYVWVGVAASIVLIAGLFFTISQQNLAAEDLGTYDDPEIALEKTKEALQLISQYMNEGTKDLRYLQEFENTKNKLIK